MFDTVLVANRGEIAVRILRTLRRLGIRGVAVYSDADAGARHVRDADVAVALGPAAARDSYLSIERVLAAAVATGAQAVHPGYGFLSESAAFATACADAGLVFVGPPAEAVRVMGDKIRAKLAVRDAGVPVIPGRTCAGLNEQDLRAAADEVGYPVMVKPSAGGGGKGMHLVHSPADLPAALGAARREAASSFGDDTLFLERYLVRPRHIEVQVLADNYGAAVHLGERECSLQRRHQKVFEEAPSVLLDDRQRTRMGAAALDTARAVGYTGVGTVEFLVPAENPQEFFFLEMNTRLQVEHPVTELVTAVDLVEQQLRVAAGEPLRLTQDDVRVSGHAVEVRVYAEDPARAFLPTGGPVLLLREPTGPHVRVDSSLLAGVDVGSVYDPMLSKVVTWGPDRPTALARLDRALAGQVVLGVATNIAFLRALLAASDVQQGRLDTEWIERHLAQLVDPAVPDQTYVAYALVRLLALDCGGDDPWDAVDGWRLSGRAAVSWQVAGPDGAPLRIAVTGTPAAATVRVGAGEPASASAVRSDDEVLVTVHGRTHRVLWAQDGLRTWLWSSAGTFAIDELPAHRSSGGGREAGSGAVPSPMPGTVIAVHVEVGDPVRSGEPLIVVEAMKMEHALTAPHDGTVSQLQVRVGDQVRVGQCMAVVTAEPAS